MDPVLQEINQHIHDTLEHLKKELAAIRAGRANPSLIEEIPVNAYGSSMPLVSLASIAAPQPTLLTVQVWDGSLVEDARKGILAANLGLNPSVDGQLLRIPLPPLTEERRQEFVKLAHQKGEEARIALRQERQNIREDWEKAQKAGEFGEDELNRRHDLLQNLMDKSNALIDQYVKEKTDELMTI